VLAVFFTHLGQFGAQHLVFRHLFFTVLGTQLYKLRIEHDVFPGAGRLYRTHGEN